MRYFVFTFFRVGNNAQREAIAYLFSYNGIASVKEGLSNFAKRSTCLFCEILSICREVISPPLRKVISAAFIRDLILSLMTYPL